MIPNQVLCNAATRAWEIYLSRLLEDYDPNACFEVSPKFEKRIRKLKRRADHPVIYLTIRRVAVVLLALIIGGIAWLSIDSSARASFFGWVHGIVETYFVSHYEGEMRGEAEPIEYRPEWLPEGYYETSFDVTSVRTRVVYTNVDNNTLRFVYMRSENEPYLFIDSSDAEIRNISINNYQGELFLVDKPDVANAITWIGPDDTLFYISGFVSENELVMIAESVKSENN